MKLNNWTRAILILFSMMIGIGLCLLIVVKYPIVFISFFGLALLALFTWMIKDHLDFEDRIKNEN
jgi:hypothetical protein